MGATPPRRRTHGLSDNQDSEATTKYVKYQIVVPWKNPTGQRYALLMHKVHTTTLDLCG